MKLFSTTMSRHNLKVEHFSYHSDIYRDFQFIQISASCWLTTLYCRSAPYILTQAVVSKVVLHCEINSTCFWQYWCQSWLAEMAHLLDRGVSHIDQSKSLRKGLTVGWVVDSIRWDDHDLVTWNYHYCGQIQKAVCTRTNNKASLIKAFFIRWSSK